VFLTKVSWDVIGGLPGLGLTLRDTYSGTGQSARSLNVYGPKGIFGVLNSGKFAGFLHEVYNADNASANLNIVADDSEKSPNFKMNVKEFSDGDADEVFRDEVFAIKRISLKPQSKRKFDDSRAKTPNQSIIAEGRASDVFCYVCSTPNVRGKFIPQKAISLGVPRGRLWGDLSNGKQVELESGVVILPDQVLEDPRPGVNFAVIDCPNSFYVNSLVSSQELKNYQSAKETLDLMIHLSPKNILQSSEYREWMNSFGSNTKHVIANDDSKSTDVVYSASTSVAKKLHTSCKALFLSCYEEKSDSGSSDNSYASNVHYCRNLLAYDISHRKTGFLEQTIPDSSTSIFDGLPDTDMSESIQNYFISGSSKQSSLFYGKLAESPNSRISFLGSGSAVPSKYRNCTGILLQLSKNDNENDFNNIFLDVAEGTYSQIARVWGIEGAQKILDQTKIIWISHIHGDHHFGLLLLVLLRSKHLEPLTIIGPSNLIKWLRGYSKNCFENFEINFIEAKSLVVSEANMESVESKAVDPFLRDLDLTRISNIRVPHCHESYGLLLEHSIGWKLVYSGDTLPTPNFAKFAKNSDILIHEATFDDSMAEEAKLRKHSTTGQAIQIAKDMNARYTILTHFSQRYPKLSSLGSGPATPLEVSAAWDMMTFSFRQLPFLRNILSPLEETLYRASEDLVETDKDV
jgi:ribonuclease Z